MTTNCREDDEQLPDASSLVERVTPDRFQSWYQEREARENIRNGTPYFNGAPSIQSPQQHSPSKLLQCQRKTAYQQLNAPEEQEDPTGIFWVGEQFEEKIALPYLREVVTGPNTYAANTLWVDCEIEHEATSLRVRGATDPVIVTREGEPILVTEIKAKSSVTHLKEPNRHHKAQAHAYLYGLSTKYDRQLTDAAIIYIGRDKLDLAVFHVEFDPAFWNETILEWAREHSEYRLNDELPPADPEMDWECEFCDYRIRCGKTNADHEDTGPVGFLPLSTEYPRTKVKEYLNSHDGAKLTPTLAHQYPDLAQSYGVLDWYCSVCGERYEWGDVEWGGDPHNPPLCASCVEEETPAPLSGPPPASQHDIGPGDEDE